jgi:RTX calcium-binding nonapeptide repeat (4 copies)
MAKNRAMHANFHAFGTIARRHPLCRHAIRWYACILILLFKSVACVNTMLMRGAWSERDGDRAMLGLIGLLGALVAGVVGDALISSGNTDDDDDPATDIPEAAYEGADLLADDDSLPATDTTEHMPAADGHDPADDLPLPQDDGSGETRISTGADEFILGTSADDWIAGAGGADTVDGGAGSDTLFGGRGDDRVTGTGDDAEDHLYGGAGDDALQIGAGDVARGDAGADEFSLSDYAPGDPPAVIADYAPGTDRIVLMYDAELHPEPMVQTEAIEGTEDVSVLLDGIQIAIVQGAAGLDYQDIELLAA